MKIGTHSGAFHCDEALAIAFLRFLPEYANAEIVRSRDPDVLAPCDIVVDVGGVYDPATHRYDHHQRGFDQVLEKSGKHSKIKLSSAGLVYKHFGRAIVARLTGLDESAKEVETLFYKMYESFVEGIDGIDNGISQYPTDAEPRYRVGSNLSARVSHLNPWWNQKDVDRDELFKKAVELTGSEFRGRLEYYSKAWLPARGIVKSALEARNSIDESGRIIKLDSFCPWKEHLYSLEEELKLDNDDQKVWYTLFEDSSGQWRIQCVSASQGSFENRKGLPKAWRALRFDELDAATGILGGVFVHAAGFIGGHKTFEGALAMARDATNAPKED